MLARLCAVALALALPAGAAHAGARLGISAVVVKSARVSVQGPDRIVLKTAGTNDVRVTLLPHGTDAVRVVFTP